MTWLTPSGTMNQLPNMPLISLTDTNTQINTHSSPDALSSVWPPIISRWFHLKKNPTFSCSNALYAFIPVVERMLHNPQHARVEHFHFLWFLFVIMLIWTECLAEQNNYTRFCLMQHIRLDAEVKFYIWMLWGTDVHYHQSVDCRSRFNLIPIVITALCFVKAVLCSIKLA